jgi:AcrR family transcriptional regulator
MIRALDTRERLLDIAEELFAENGVDSISIRSINAAAQLSPGILHYHFGNKDTLLEAIVTRRMDEIIGNCQAMISSRDYDNLLSTEAVAAILVMPLVSFVGKNKQRGLLYLSLIARLHGNKSQTLSTVSQRHQDQLFIPLQQLLNESCKHLSSKQLSLRINFVRNTLLQSACEWPLDEIELDLQANQLITFIAAGLGAK